jgi:signal transduction histidine kinase/ActR/RegA family two-component response regulator
MRRAVRVSIAANFKLLDVGMSVAFMKDESETPPPSVAETRWPIAWTNRLQRLAAVLSAVADPASVVRAAVNQGRAALEADAGAVFLLSAEGGSAAMVEIAHVSGYATEVVRPWDRFPLSASTPATDAIRSGQAVIVRSRDEMRRLYPVLGTAPGSLVHESWAAVPLVVDGVCIGAFGLSFAAGQAFEAQEVAFLRVVADHCAQALHRAQLAERERRSTARLRVMAEASRVFAAASLDVASVLNEMAAQVLAHLGHSCSIALASPDGQWLEVAVIQDQDPERERRLREVAGTLRVRRGEGVSGKVLASGTPVLLARIAPNEMAMKVAPAVAPQIEALRVRSFLAVALKTRGRTLGTITSSRYDEGNPFTADDQALLEDLADRAALAIENARLHQAEREARTRAEEADRRKDEFIAMLGHELRNPLAPIWTGIEILRQLPVQDQRQVWVHDVMGRQVAQLSRLVDDLLDVSRINLGKIELRFEALDLAVVARQALEASRPLLSERKLQVAVDLPPAPVRVRGDAVRLTQVISNLLNNAAKYTDPAGRVQLSVAARGAEAIVTVSDTGIGIPAELLDRVFDLFAQGREARDRSKGGLGIGLTLVKRLVEMHGGYVRGSSPGEGQGSEFVLGFPLFEAAVSTQTHGAALATPGLAARRVLIADDNVDAAEGLRVLMELQRHHVEVVHDGAAAVEAMSRSEPEVVLLDISLPVIDGLEVARRIRAQSGVHQPLLVAVTGLGREEDRQRSVDAGFDHHLVKPIDPASLVALLDGAPGAPANG